MNKKIFDFSVFAVAVIIISILFSACGSNADPVDSEEESNTSAPIVSENVSDSDNDEYDSVYEYYQCFVAWEGEMADENNLTPGYLYFREDWESEIRLLLAKKIKDGTLADFKNSVYVITDEDEIIEVSKIDGSYKTVYTAKHGSIDYISGVRCVNRYVYFNDGNYIIELDPITNECTEKLESDKKIISIIPGGDVIKYNEYAIYCDICGGEGEYFIWIAGSEDEGYESYWHHPETGEDELIDLNYVFTYGGDFKEEYNHLGWKVKK